MTQVQKYDVIVVGAGNAALAAAVSAHENGVERVLVLEKAPREMRGGNTHWSGGVLRFAFDDPEEVGEILPDAHKQFENFYAGIQPYGFNEYHGDLMRVSNGRTDPELSRILVQNSKETVKWMQSVGKIEMEPAVTLSAVRKGKRFVDEGEDAALFTYAKFGRSVLAEPGAKAWQIFDSQTVHLLEPRYQTSEPIKADTLEALIAQLDFEDKAQALRTLEEYNAAAQSRDESFDPTKPDGVSTKGLALEKTNWGIKIDQPPFYAYSATGGITFTFGGLRIDANAQVIGTDWRPIPGLYCCGEMVGGLFYDNYPAGTGLVSGATFGRIAGRNAATKKR
ncbi:FAD-dependent oxidoreductase [Paracoccus sp. (in: a-proteobacteria)]|uniref:FAD-dependent oxidoreductase n=1 Tax=Paracoccus sp. TaxID=267 RepID=UPI002AFFFA4B|nr:FAD-dependent oxidoreductase [Paracoccus sp. (in: a-proteobacteria)]